MYVQYIQSNDLQLLGKALNFAFQNQYSLRRICVKRKYVFPFSFEKRYFVEMVQKLTIDEIKNLIEKAIKEENYEEVARLKKELESKIKDNE